MQGKAAVAGIGESTYYVRGKAPDTEFQLACTAIGRAARDAGLRLEDIDGIVSYMDVRNPPVRLARALGLKALNFTADPFSGGGNNVENLGISVVGDFTKTLPKARQLRTVELFLRVEMAQYDVSAAELFASLLDDPPGSWMKLTLSAEKSTVISVSDSTWGVIEMRVMSTRSKFLSRGTVNSTSAGPSLAHTSWRQTWERSWKMLEKGASCAVDALFTKLLSGLLTSTCWVRLSSM